MDTERLKAALDGVGWTQKRLAEELRVSKQVVSAWMHGKPAGRANTARAAEALGVSVDYLLGRTTQEGSPGAAREEPRRFAVVAGGDGPTGRRGLGTAARAVRAAPGEEAPPSDIAAWMDVAQRLIQLVREQNTIARLRIEQVESVQAKAQADMAHAARLAVEGGGGRCAAARRYDDSAPTDALSRSAQETGGPATAASPPLDRAPSDTGSSVP